MATRKAPTARKQREKTAPAGETKEAKFSRLATARVRKALKDISLLGNLAGAGYAYNPNQIDKMRELLNDQIKTTFSRFSKSGGTDSVKEIVI